MEFIRSWSGQIITSVIIASILEMILPEGKNKKYIKMVIGVYVIFTIVSPVISKFTNKPLELDFKKYEKYLNKDTYVSSNRIDQLKEDNIQNIYEENLKKDIQERLKEKGYKASNIKLNLDLKSSNSYGSINKVEMRIEKNKEKKEDNSIKMVNKIQIGNQIEESSKVKLTRNEQDEIKSILKEAYGVNEDQITFLN